MFGFTPFDWVIIVAIILSGAFGFKRAFTREVMGIGAVLVAIFAAWFLEPTLSAVITFLPEKVAASVSFAVLFCLGYVVSILVLRGMAAAGGVDQSTAARLAGGLIGSLRGALLIGAVLYFIVTPTMLQAVGGEKSVLAPVTEKIFEQIWERAKLTAQEAEVKRPLEGILNEQAHEDVSTFVTTQTEGAKETLVDYAVTEVVEQASEALLASDEDDDFDQEPEATDSPEDVTLVPVDASEQH